MFKQACCEALELDTAVGNRTSKLFGSRACLAHPIVRSIILLAVTALLYKR